MWKVHRWSCSLGRIISIRFLSSSLKFGKHIQSAIEKKMPVVCLESTIITHGMPFPQNLKTALRVQDIILEQGAVPATVGILNGQIKVGLSDDEISLLAQKDENVVKVSRRDLPYAVSKRMNGGTTVASTMIIAHMAGIPIFVTGGIGGVHRGGELSWDVSADLMELGRTPVAVISSGVKSILDIGKTLEVLETQGVAVATFGVTNDFPAFYSRKSNFKSPCHLASVDDAVAYIKALRDLNLQSGQLIAVPVPEEFAIADGEIEEAISCALALADQQGVTGAKVTPFVLKHIAEITAGRALAANIALIENNARVGGQIAVGLNRSLELSKKRGNIVKPSGLRSLSESGCSVSGSVSDRSVSGSVSDRSVSGISCDRAGSVAGESSSDTSATNCQVAVIGGSILDLVVHVSNSEFKPKAVFFTCMDSRMIPTRFTETNVGDMFVVRNAGNLIPHSRNYPDQVTTTEPAALELGCVINDIRHVIVCGHSDCKAMNLLYSLRDDSKACLTNQRLSPLKAWMCTHASSSLEKYQMLVESDFQMPMIFEAETPQQKFVAYIDPENKFAVEDKLSQADGRTLDGEIRWSRGGVARNIADALVKLGNSVCFVSAIGRDHFGEFLTDEIPDGLELHAVEGCEKTAVCLVACDREGNNRLLVGDMGAHKSLSAHNLKKLATQLSKMSLIVFDGNIPTDGTSFLLKLAAQFNIPVFFEPTDIARARHPFQSDLYRAISFISPNSAEFVEIVSELLPEVGLKEDDSVKSIGNAACLVAQHVNNVFVTLGQGGVLIARRGTEDDTFFTKSTSPKLVTFDSPINYRLYTPTLMAPEDIVNVSGAGDCFASGFISAMLKGLPEKECVNWGFQASRAALASWHTVPKDLNNILHSIHNRQ